MMFSRKIFDDAKVDARNKYPQESCGVITGDEYVACDNVASDPIKDFKISSTITDPLIMAHTLQGIIHSHPTDNLLAISCPTKEDMTSQIAMNVPWGIIDLDTNHVNDPFFWGDFLLDEPLIGQTFHHGVRDCLSLIRKYFWQKRGIKMAEFPRSDLWWRGKTEDDMYEQNFVKAGFIKIKKEELQDGDVFCGKIRSDKINHGGIYLDNDIDGHGVVLHHTYGRLSHKESAYPYLNRAELFLRYVGHAS